MKTGFAVLPGGTESLEGNDLSDAAFEDILSAYDARLDIPKQKPETLFCVVMVGLIATGKTTIMKRLSKRLGLVRICTDDIRRLLLEQGFNFVRTREIAGRLYHKYLSQGYAIGVDADGAGAYIQENLAQVEKDAKEKVFWLHVTAPEEVVLERLQEDNPDRDYKGPTAIGHYYRRKQLYHQHFPMSFIYTFDTSKDNLEEQLDEAEAAICAQLGVDKMEKL